MAKSVQSKLLLLCYLRRYYLCLNLFLLMIVHQLVDVLVESFTLIWGAFSYSIVLNITLIFAIFRITNLHILAIAYSLHLVIVNLFVWREKDNIIARCIIWLHNLLKWDSIELIITKLDHRHLFLGWCCHCLAYGTTYNSLVLIKNEAALCLQTLMRKGLLLYISQVITSLAQSIHAPMPSLNNSTIILSNCCTNLRGKFLLRRCGCHLAFNILKTHCTTIQLYILMRSCWFDTYLVVERLLLDCLTFLINYRWFLRKVLALLTILIPMMVSATVSHSALGIYSQVLLVVSWPYQHILTLNLLGTSINRTLYTEFLLLVYILKRKLLGLFLRKSILVFVRLSYRAREFRRDSINELVARCRISIN